MRQASFPQAHFPSPQHSRCFHGFLVSPLSTHH
jgi:hypothetical protein